MRSNRSFFDPSLAENGGAAFIKESKIDEALVRLIPKAHITKGHVSYPSRSELRDLVWNHMDQNHRPFIHRTYGEASRIFIDRHGSFSMTRFGRWPIIIPVFDGYFKENGFYQVIVLFGLIAVVTIIECNAAGLDTKMDVSWAIASHRWLRVLHPLLNKRFIRLNVVQNREDDPIRDRRVALRAAGYHFATDAADFINSNAIGHNVVFPPLSASHSISIADMPEEKPHRIEFGDRAYILRRVGATIEVWPGICLHEGATLVAGDMRGNMVKCPWHGLEFGPRRLSPSDPTTTLCGARLELGDGRLNISPARGEPS